MPKPKPVVIVGGGLAGIACARMLHRQQIPYVLLEAEDRVGGKLKTDWVQGFGCDRGFQVLFTAYPTVERFVPLGKLNPKPFIPGALVWDGHQLHSIRQDRPFATATNGLFSMKDKLLVLQLNQELESTEVSEIYSMPDVTANEYLSAFGFSSDFIRYFARPLFGSIFLDKDLGVSARQFAFVWKMLNQGQTVLPSQGIEALPRAMAEPLFDDNIRTNRAVTAISGDADEFVVQMENGETFDASQVVLACDIDGTNALLSRSEPVKHRASTCLYFEADTAITSDPIICLNATDGLVSTVVPVSVVSPELAPKGKHLVSVTMIGDHERAPVELAHACLTEIAPWFPQAAVRQWRHIRTCRVTKAQLAQEPGSFKATSSTPTQPGIYLAGEYFADSSINGAIRSGMDAAIAVSQTSWRNPSHV